MGSRQVGQDEVVAAERLLVSKLRGQGSCVEGFRKMDRRGDGHIDAEELRVGAAKVFGLDVPPAVAEAIVRRHVGPGEGAMDLQGFCELWEGSLTRWATASGIQYADHGIGRVAPGDVAACAPTESQQLQALLGSVGTKLRAHVRSEARSRKVSELFLQFDRDNSGSLSYAEIHYGLQCLGIDLSPAETAQVCTHIDPQLTGAVSLYGFLTLMQRNAASAAPGGGQPGAGPESVEEAAQAHADLLPHPPVPRAYEAAIKDGDSKEAAVARIVGTLGKKRLELKEAFAKFDRKGDGTLDADELVQGLGSLGIEISPERAARLVKTYDRTGSGRLQYWEFVQMVSTTMAAQHDDGGGEGQAAAEQGPDEHVLATIALISSRVYDDFCRVRKAFSKFDRDGTKQISPAELKRAMADGGFELADGDVAAIYALFDKSGSGTLSYSEFVAMLGAAA